MSKIPAQRVPSDDCVIDRDGVSYRPHAGEWIEVRRGQTVGDYLQQIRLAQLLASARELGQAALAGQEAQETLAALESALRDSLEHLASRIVRWTWTDDTGQPYPERPAAGDLARLDMAELEYVRRVVSGDMEAEARKNGSRPSTGRSTARASRRRSG